MLERLGLFKKTPSVEERSTEFLNRLEVLLMELERLRDDTRREAENLAVRINAMEERYAILKETEEKQNGMINALGAILRGAHVND